MRRRLDIAMGLVGNSPVIFLDDPTTGLDPEALLEVWKIIKELAGSGTTVFLTTQYLDETEQLADRVAILRHGGDHRERHAGGTEKAVPASKRACIKNEHKSLFNRVSGFADFLINIIYITVVLIR